MPIYNYKALTEHGRVISGETAAGSDTALRRDLAARGLLVQQIRPALRIARFGSRRSVPREEFALWVQELLALLRAGLTVHETLGVCATRPDQPAFEQILQRVRADVGNGMPFSVACRQHPEVFDSLFVSAIATGEHSGDLPSVLSRYLRYLEGSIALNRRIAQALAYPVFLLLVLAVVMGLLFAFVLPRFISMYAGMDAELPWPTRALIRFVDHAGIIAPVAALAFMGAWVALRTWASGQAGRLALDRIRMRLPFVGRLQRMRATAQSVRTLATLLGAGMPLLEAMGEGARVCLNQAYGRDWLLARGRVSEGVALASALEAYALVPATATKMIAAGEASGRLDELLDQVADHLEQNLSYRIDRMTRLIEPALMLLMGVLVGGIIVVMYLPIFSMAEVIR